MRSSLVQISEEQYTFRDRAIEKVKELVAEHSLSRVIMATAISYFDLYLDKLQGELSKDDCHNCMLCCLLIAAKFHEGCQSNPKSSVLARYLKNILHDSGMRALELKIANSLEWNLDIQTPTHFVNFFINRGRRILHQASYFLQTALKTKKTRESKKPFQT